MTQTIDKKNLERKLIRAFALADAWFDFADDGAAVMNLGQRILAVLNKLQSMLTRMKAVPAHNESAGKVAIDDRDLLSEYFYTVYDDCIDVVASDENVRELLRDHLYHCLVLLELESTPGLAGTTVTLYDGKTIPIADYVRLVVFTVDTVLEELNDEAANP